MVTENANVNARWFPPDNDVSLPAKTRTDQSRIFVQRSINTAAIFLLTFFACGALDFRSKPTAKRSTFQRTSMVTKQAGVRFRQRL